MNDLEGVDTYDGEPMAALVNAMVLASGAVNSRAVRELAFLRYYSPALYASFGPWLLDIKLRQNPGTLKRLERIGNALAIKEFISKINLSMGGK